MKLAGAVPMERGMPTGPIVGRGRAPLTLLAGARLRPSLPLARVISAMSGNSLVCFVGHH